MGLVVGIDLGRKSAHDAVLFRRETRRQVGKGIRFTTTVEGLDRLLQRIERVREDQEQVEFVIDSPGRAWVPIASALINQGFSVYRPTTSLMKSVRQGTNRKNKSNKIDAQTLARCLRILRVPIYLAGHIILAAC